jgi:putative transposase
MYPKEFNPELYREKYRIKSMRYPNWDYASDGWYFITICTQNRAEYFGDVRDYAMDLSDIGRVTAKFWQEIPKHFPFTRLDEWVVMPDHLHGIIVIDKYDDNNRNENNHNPVNRRDVALQRLYGENANVLRIPKYQKNNEIHQFFSKISPKPQSLSTIIRSFKSISTKTINQKYPEIDFAWQPRFYDHIIRDQKSLDEIRQYIHDNPEKWESDRNNSGNLRM